MVANVGMRIATRIHKDRGKDFHRVVNDYMKVEF